MKVFASSIGSLGDVAPVAALAIELKAMGHRAVVGVLPHWKDWIESRGVSCVAIEVPRGSNMHELARDMVRVQFEATASAARDCNLIVGFGPQPLAGRSVAEHLGIGYVFATYSPCLLPSPDHAPPTMHPRGVPQQQPAPVNRLLWWLDAKAWNRFYGDAINEQRGKLGLKPVRDIARYVWTDTPWLAADPVLGPAGAQMGIKPIQTGAWMLEDSRPLPAAVERFLAAGAPPAYLGFGSMPITPQTSRTLAQAARAAGFRAIVRGCGIESGSGVLAVNDLNYGKLFRQCAAIVHHGGGSTITAALSGKPQIIVPHVYDQFWWARRLEQLGVGINAGAAGQLTVERLTAAIGQCMKPEIRAAAKSLAGRIELRGARIAAERIVDLVTQSRGTTAVVCAGG